MAYTYSALLSRSRRFPWSAPPSVQFGLWALAGLGPLVLLVTVVLGLAQPLAVAVPMLAYGGAVALAGFFLRRTFAYPTLGLCNAVTLGRLVAVAALTGPLVAGAEVPWAVFCVAALALALDGLDGWLARYEGRVSAFGARFDMEVDAALALCLALLAWRGDSAGPVVLILGMPRYGFVAGGLIWPWLAAPLPERFGRKVVCVVQMALLIALQLPFMGGVAGGILAVFAALALAWSFGRDIIWLWRVRG